MTPNELARNRQAHENARLAATQRDNAVAAHRAQNDMKTHTKARRTASLVRFVDGLRSKGIPDEFILAHVPESDEEAAFQAASDQAIARFQEATQPPTPPTSECKPAIGATTPALAAYAKSLSLPR